MADELDDIDIAGDFEEFAVGLKPVTVRQIDPDSGDTITEVENVPATKLVRHRSPFAAGGGEVGGDTVRFVFRADRLDFLPKARDEIETEAGEEWHVESAELIAFEQLCGADCVRKRG